MAVAVAVPLSEPMLYAVVNSHMVSLCVSVVIALHFTLQAYQSFLRCIMWNINNFFFHFGFAFGIHTSTHVMSVFDFFFTILNEFPTFGPIWLSKLETIQNKSEIKWSLSICIDVNSIRIKLHPLNGRIKPKKREQSVNAMRTSCHDENNENNAQYIKIK